MRTYTIRYRAVGIFSDEESIDVTASNTHDAYYKAQDELKRTREIVAWGLYVDSVTYKNGVRHEFNNDMTNPY